MDKAFAQGFIVVMIIAVVIWLVGIVRGKLRARYYGRKQQVIYQINREMKYDAIPMAGRKRNDKQA